MVGQSLTEEIGGRGTDGEDSKEGGEGSNSNPERYGHVVITFGASIRVVLISV